MKLCSLIFFLLISRSLSAGPYELYPLHDGILLSFTTASSAWLFLEDNPDKHLTEDEVSRLNKNNINFLDRFATEKYSPDISLISDILLCINLAAPLALLGEDESVVGRSTIGVMIAENFFSSLAVAGLSKSIIDRHRPYVYNAGVPFYLKNKLDAKSSFFSGHTTLAFASSVFLISTIYELHPESKNNVWITSGSLFLAGTVGLLRIESGKHFPTDVITGAAVGSIIGWLIPQIHKDKTGKIELDRIQSVPIVKFRVDL